MGLMPQVYDLPMRLAEPKDPAKQAFKDARIRVVGWCQPPEETKGIANIMELEVELIERPTRIKILIMKPRSKGSDPA